MLLSIITSFMLQPPPLEMQWPRYSTPPTCDAGRAGRVYYDTDDTLTYYCNGTAWTTFVFTLSGTNPFLARFNSAGNNVENSDLRNSGAPAAGSGGSILDLTKTINAMNGSDTINGFFIDLTGASHSGAGNFLYGLHIDTLASASANASEYAVRIGSDWDLAWYSTDGHVQIKGAGISAGTSGTIVSFPGSINAMNGSDTVKIIGFSLTNGNHTGSGNTLTAIDFGGIAPDAEATEQAIAIGGSGETTNWDIGIRFRNDNHPHVYFEGNDSGEVNAIFDSLDDDPSYNFTGSDNTVTLVRFQEGPEITQLMGTDLAVVGAAQTVNPNSNVVEVSAGAAASISSITAPTATSHTERVTFICADANVTFNDADAAGAANTLNLAGAATNFTCSADDTITFVFYVSPASGNARWVETGRSVN